MTCAACKKNTETLDIRGRKMCLKCHIEFLWDFAEGTRKMLPQINSPDNPSISDLYKELQKNRGMLSK